MIRARQEEVRGTAELVRSGAVGRERWISSWLVVAALAIVTVVAAAVAGAAVGIASQPDGDASLLRDAAVAGSGQALAASVLTALTAGIVAVAPRLTVAGGWALFAAATVVGLFGPIVGLPDAVVRVSPFASSATMSGDTVELRGVAWLALAVAVALVVTFAAARRRELRPDG